MPAQPDWSDDFFIGPWIDLHLSMRSPFDIQRETDAVTALLDLPPGASVVDVPCGPGDHCIELARRGFRVTGVDRSEVLLEHARRRAADAGVAPTFLSGDMRSVRLTPSFDALICLWGSFGYFDDEGDRCQLETFHSLIRPGGQLLLDVLPLEGILMHFEPRDSHRTGSMIVVQDRRYDQRGQRLESDWAFHRGDECIRRTTSMRLYTLREALALLEGAGFDDVRFLDPETREPFSLGSVRAWACARRR